MAFIQTISYSLQASIKVAEYQYEKPTISMTAVLEEGDSYETVLTSLKEEIHNEMEKIKNEF